MNRALALARVEHRVRPMLASVLPADKFIKFYSLIRTYVLDMLASSEPCANVPRSPVNLSGEKFSLKFRNGLSNAAGFDKDGSLLPFNYLLGAGYAVVGTVLDKPNAGNLMPVGNRLVNPWAPFPHSKSAINTLGLPSKGVDVVVENIRDFREAFEPEDFPIVASVMPHPKDTDMGQKLHSISDCVRKLLPVVDLFEVNDSCPNTSHDNSDLELRVNVVLNLRNDYFDKTGIYRPVFFKLRDAGDANHTVEVFSRLRVDGVVLTNTQIDYAKIRKKLHPKDLKIFDRYMEISGQYAKDGNGKPLRGGVSGRVIKEATLSEIVKASKAIEQQSSHLQLIHVGGIETHKDVENGRAVSHVALQEWYTGFMDALGVIHPDRLYKSMILGPPKKAPYEFKGPIYSSWTREKTLVVP